MFRIIDKDTGDDKTSLAYSLVHGDFGINPGDIVRCDDGTEQEVFSFDRETRIIKLKSKPVKIDVVAKISFNLNNNNGESNGYDNDKCTHKS